MSAHIAPHRWADAWAGRVSAAERRLMDEHADRCRACSRARERVTCASDSFSSIRAQVAPELSWDSVRARVHWWVSKERNEGRERAPRVPSRRLIWPTVAVAAAAAVALIVPHASTSNGWSVLSDPTAHRTTPAPGRAEPAAKPTALTGLVTRVSGELSIDGKGMEDAFARRLGAGSLLVTRDGHADVQFGVGSAFALGPRSTIELRRFDSAMIELAVDGTIDVEVAPRAPGQRFIVVAGDRTVEVRGTQFRVQRTAQGTTVACRHGLVAVSDGRDPAPVAVGAARRISLGPDQRLAAAKVEPMSTDELGVLADATPLALPSITRWEDADALAASSAPLDLTATAPREVRVDGIEVGRAPLHVRVMLGRHTVEAADRAGRFRRVGWVDVAAPSTEHRIAHLTIPSEQAPSKSLGERPRQLRAGVDHARLRGCMRSIAKAGLTGTFVHIEIAVDAQGAVGFLNVIDTDLPSATARCVRDVLADVRFGAGTAASWRERFDL